MFLIIVFGKDATLCKKIDEERFRPITSNWEDCNNASKALKVKEICTDAIGTVEGNVSLCASNVSLPKGCIEYEENKVGFSLAGKDEPTGRERILCKGNKKIDYIFPVDLKNVRSFLNKLLIFDVHITVCTGIKGICVTVKDCCCNKAICGKGDDCCLGSNGVEVKCVDVYYHKQKIVKRECREYGREDKEPTTTTTKATKTTTPTVDDRNNHSRGGRNDEF